MSDDRGEMELVAFGFRESSHAAAAERGLRELLDVEDQDLSIADLAGSPEFVDGCATILAGRIREPRLPAARALVEGHGGEVLTDVPESWLGQPPREGRPL